MQRVKVKIKVFVTFCYSKHSVTNRIKQLCFSHAFIADFEEVFTMVFKV